MHTIKSDIDRADGELTSEFKGIPTAIISDVTGNVGRTMDSGIKPSQNRTKMAGTAITVKASPGDNLIIHKAITMAEPGDVLVIDGNGYTDAAYLGELMCASCKANNLSGIVIDGAIRDQKEINEMGLPVYARGVNPQGPLKQDPGSINVDITCGGVTIEPGDIVVGDNEGVISVPVDRAETILENAREKLNAENEVRKRVEKGEYLYDISNYKELFEEMNVVQPEDTV